MLGMLIDPNREVFYENQYRYSFRSNSFYTTEIFLKEETYQF